MMNRHRKEITMSDNSYPKVLVLSRSDPDLDPPTLVMRDGLSLHTEQEVRDRLSMFYGFEAMGAIPYNYTPVPEAQVEEYMTNLRRELGI